MQFRAECVKRPVSGAVVLAVLAGVTAAHAGSITTTYTAIPGSNPPRAKLRIELSDMPSYSDLHIMTRGDDEGQANLFTILPTSQFQAKCGVDGVTKHGAWGNQTYLDLLRSENRSGNEFIELEGPAGRGRQRSIKVTLNNAVVWGGTGATFVPDPGSLGLLALGGLGALRRRRR